MTGLSIEIILCLNLYNSSLLKMKNIDLVCNYSILRSGCVPLCFLMNSIIERIIVGEFVEGSGFDD